MIKWDHERGRREGYVDGKIRFCITYVDGDYVEVSGNWHAVDVKSNENKWGTLDECMQWCAERVVKKD